jgi:capsid protein
MAGSEFSEGEGFSALVSSSQADAPQLQLIDPGEVEYYASAGIPPSLLQTGDTTYFDGVKLNKKGKIIAYAVRVTDGGGPGGSEDVDAPNMIHFCTRKRPNQYRGVTPFAAVANSGVDALDLRALGIATAKLHTALAIAYTKASGPAMGANGFTDQIKNLLAATTTENGTQVPTGQTVVGEEVFAGAMVKHLGPGDDLKLLTSQNPSVNLLHFMEWLYRDVATGPGLSPEIVWNLSLLGGVNARINLADLQAFLDFKQGRLNQRFNQTVYRWWLCKKFNNGYPYPNDPRWWNCHWLGPAKITGDAGNKSQALIQEIGAGFGTWAEYWASLGKSWKGQIRQRILEVKFAMQQCTLEGVPYEKVFPPAAGAAQASPMGGGSAGAGGGGDGGGGIST